MKRILIITGAIFAVLLLALVALPFLIPSSVYKAQIEKAASGALGRTVTLEGDPKLSVFPVISARLDGMRVTNPDGYSQPLMIDAGSLKASIRLRPLFARRVEISEITLSDTSVWLERLETGEANWEFDDGSQRDTVDESDPGGAGFAGGIDRASLNNASVSYVDKTTGTQYVLESFTASARLKALDAPLTSTGGGRLNGQAFDYDIRLETLAALSAAQPVALKVGLNTDYGTVSYDGRLTLGDVPQFEGEFDLASDTLGAILTVLGNPDLPIKASELKSLRAKGSVSGPATSAAVSFSDLTLKATGLDLTYVGDIAVSEAPTLNGKVTVKGADLQRLLKTGDPLADMVSLVGAIDFTAAVSGPATAPSLSAITLKQRGTLLRTDYTGAVSLARGQDLDGALDVASDNPRDLLAALGTELPPGETLTRFALKGQTKGSLMAPSLNAMTLTLDDMTATGNLGAELKGARPRITATMRTDRLDLSPFMAADPAAPKTEPNLNQDWDSTPLDLAGLKAIDATLTINAGQVILDKITLVDAVLNTRLDNGRLSAIFRQDENKPGFKVFNGNWSGDLVLDASKATPTLTVVALADSIAAQEMLGSLTGYKGLSGIGDVQLDLSSQGSSLKALIEGLDGRFESDLSQGGLKGVNLAKLVRDGSNLKELIASGNLSVSSFRDAISPEAETDFSSFIGNLAFADGVASITDLRLDNPVVGVTGSGSINLGERTIDIRLVPRVDVNAQGAGSTIGLANIPVPLRISGSWAAPKFGLDSAAVQAELTARARGAVGDRVREQVGGEVGAILGEIVGGNRGSAPASPTETPGGTEAPAPQANRSLEDELKDRAVEGALGAILGNRRPKAAPVEEPPAEVPPPSTEEPSE